MDDWFEKVEGVEKKTPDDKYLQHHQTSHFFNCNNSTLNYNNGISEQTRWDTSTQGTHIDQSNINILTIL